jgi:hypothetical protein
MKIIIGKTRWHLDVKVNPMPKCVIGVWIGKDVCADNGWEKSQEAAWQHLGMRLYGVGQFI